MQSMSAQPAKKRCFASISSIPFELIRFPEKDFAEEGPTVCTLYAVTHRSGTGPYIGTCRHGFARSDVFVSGDWQRA